MEIKIVFVGDSSYKTSFVTSLSDKPVQYYPTHQESFKLESVIDGKSYIFSMWDTSTEEEYERLRPLAYSNANIIVITFSVISRSSFNNITEKWLGEVKHYTKDAAYVLVGLELDQYQKGNPNHVSTEEIEEYVNEHKLHGFVTCSVKANENMDKVLPTFIHSLEKKREEKKSFCNIC